MKNAIFVLVFFFATLARADGDLVVTDITPVEAPEPSATTEVNSATSLEIETEPEVAAEPEYVTTSDESYGSTDVDGGGAVEAAGTAGSSYSAPSQYGTSQGSGASGSTLSDDGLAGELSAEFFAVFYGPSIGKPSAYQPTPYGEKDIEHPVVLRNFLGVGYNVTDEIAITPTASWLWSPIGRSVFTLQDPYIRVSHSSVWSTSITNLYSDFRVHLPITRLSQDERMLLGVQTFNSFVMDVPGTSLSVGTYASARMNFFGKMAYGNDLELYLAPNLNYQYSDNASVILVYEMNAVHVLGTQAWQLENSGTALQPGMAWLVTDRLMLNPYLNIATGGRVSLSSTSIGLNLSLRMI
jgi:hypothetical protein